MADATAPTTELGNMAALVATLGGRRSGPSVPSWDALMGDAEHVPELKGTSAFRAYDRMMTDAQVAAVMASTILPLMRYDWVLRPQPGVSDDALERIAADTGLTIEGAERQEGVDGGRFTFHEHLRAALRCLRYGVMPFEQVGTIDDDGWFRYRKLAERPPHTLDALNVAPDGGLVSITQEATGLTARGVEIPVNRLLVYSWEREGAAWQGRSMLRPMYKHWVVKDRLLRVDALKHERNGMGLPTAWAPPGATDEVMAALQEITSAMKAGEESGMTMPPGSDIRLLGVQGSLPDTIASVRYHDEQISKAGLALFLDLATSASGNRALSQTFEGMFGVAIDYIAQFVAATFTQHAIRDWFQWNVGADAAFPLLVAQRPANPELVVSDFRSLVEVGALALTPDDEAWVRRKVGAPPKVEQEDAAPTGAPFGYDLDSGIITIDERRAQLGLEARPDGLGTLTVPEFLAKFPAASTTAAIAGVPPTAATEPDPQDAGLPETVQAARRLQRWSSALARLKPRRGQHVHAAAPGAKRASDFDPKRYPENARRQPFDHEVRAATDFTVLLDEWDSARSKLVEEWRKVRAEQDAQLMAAIVDADGDLAKLANLPSPVAGADVLDRAMLDMADSAARLMAAEAKAQGATIPTVDRDDLADMLAGRSDLAAQTMADDLASGVRKVAGNLTGGALTPAQVAEQVGQHLATLTDAYLEQQLGNVLTIAQNQGRMAAAEQAMEPASWYASELLDANTCPPCAAIDGKLYATVAEARADYPVGGYKDCDGRERCRGTIVVVYDDEAPPTLQGDMPGEGDA